MSAGIEIHTHDTGLIFDILGKPSAKAGESIDTPGNARLTYNGSFIRKSLGMPEIIDLTIVFGTGVAASVVGNWLYDKIKGKAVKVLINRKEVELDKGEITRAIETNIRIEK